MRNLLEKYRGRISARLLIIILLSILLLATVLTAMSTMIIRSSYNQLYEEKLLTSSRVLLAQYSYLDIAPYIEKLKNRENFAEDARSYLSDRKYVAAIRESHPDGDFPTEYYDAQNRMASYRKEFSDLKDDKYYSIYKRLLEVRVATGVKYLYVVADLGLPDMYAFLFDAFFQVDLGIVDSEDLGTVDMQVNYPEIGQVYKSKKTVFAFEGHEYAQNSVLYCAYTPVMDDDGHVIAVIVAEVNLESLSTQLNRFLIVSIIIVVVMAFSIIMVMFWMLSRIIIKPVRNLTTVSSEIARGNISVEIPDWITVRTDEMGILGKSYESMRAVLHNLVSNNKVLFEAAMIGKLDTRGDSSRFKGLFAQLIDKMNDTLDVIGIYFDSIPGSLVILDPEYDIVFSNKNFKQTFSEFSAKQIYQKLLQDTDDDYDALKKKFADVLKRAEYNTLLWFEFGDEKRCFSFMCSRVVHENNDSGAVMVILDNTELVLAKDKALLANQAKSEFLSRVSHELRTPLNVIMSMAKLGMNDGDLSESRTRFQKIVTSSSHLSKIINDVLEMSRMESGKTEIRYAPMELLTVVAECVDLLALNADEKGIALTSSVDASIPNSLIGDEFRVRQILINLLSNAIKFTDGGGRVSIDVTLEKKDFDGITLNFAVADTGIGMSEDFLAKIFKPFEQEDLFLNRRYQGSGLGLSISHNLVALMGGKMEVESRLGQGSRFNFTIPFKTVSDDARDIEPSQPQGDLKDEEMFAVGKRLLLVDDIDINRMIVCEILEGSGIEIDEAADGEEAFAKYASAPLYHYDCILMDIQMPKMDGYQTTKAIRGCDRADNNVPVIAMTANALKEDIKAALDSGMNEHIAKPLDFDVCIQMVKKYCAGDG